MAEVASSDMTVDEFLAWAMEQPGRYELELGHCHRDVAGLGHLRAKNGAFNASRRQSPERA